MGTDRDSTHTVVVRTENRGIRVVVGAAVLYLWLRWWWTGSLFASVASAVPPQVNEGEFGSVTGTLLPIAVDLLGFVGSIVISIGGLGWRVVWDFVSGILETIGLFTKQKAATQAAVDAATESATIPAATHAGSAAWPERLTPVQTYSRPIPQRRVDLDKVAAALQSQDTELDDLDRLVNELRKRLDGHANRLTEIEATGNSNLLAQAEINEAIDERVLALEQSTIKRPPTRKATRQAPAKRSTKAKA